MRGLCYFLLSILTQVGSGTINVTGLIGHNVTLPCMYNVQTHGVLSFCWGRGPVPRLRCSNSILTSEDGAVQFRQSSKYQLLGVTAGDVSLTILDAQLSDAGVYGCRVEVPGWFNDYKLDTHLLMEQEISATQRPEDALYNKSPIQRITSPDSSSAFLNVGNIGRTGVIFLVTVIIIVLIFWRGRKARRTLEHPTASTVENIYDSVPMPE